jgi:phage-related protein
MEVFWRKKEKQKEGTEGRNEILQRKEEQISEK